MPNPKLYKNQKQWMKDCLHQTMHMERKEREQSIAQCLQMWRDREKKKRKERARSVAASWLNSQIVPYHRASLHQSEDCGSEAWICNECKEHLIKNRYNYFVLKDDLWSKLNVEPVNGHQYLCWDCMEKRFKSIFHRSPTGKDFTENTFNKGNSKVQELNRKRGVPDSKNIAIIVGIFKDLEEKKYHLQTNVVANNALRSLVPEKIRTSTVLSELLDLAKKYMRDMKKAYPDSEIIVEGNFFLNELREFSRAIERRHSYNARAIPTTKIEELPGAQIEKPVMQAVKALMEEHPVSSGWHHGFSKKFNGLEPCWAIIFNRELSDRAKKAIKDSGLKIKARGEYSDVYLEGVKKEDLEQATKAFNKLAEKYESIG